MKMGVDPYGLVGVIEVITVIGVAGGFWAFWESQDCDPVGSMEPNGHLVKGECKIKCTKENCSSSETLDEVGPAIAKVERICTQGYAMPDHWEIDKDFPAELKQCEAKCKTGWDKEDGSEELTDPDW